MPYEGIVLPIELKKHFVNREIILWDLWKKSEQSNTFEVTHKQLLLTNVERNKGIEPSYSAWKADILTIVLTLHSFKYHLYNHLAIIILGNWFYFIIGLFKWKEESF